MDSALSCREHLPREEALQILRDRFAPLPARPVPLEQASGEVLAEEVVGARNVPHYPAAAVDGYALASEDTAQASPARPVLLSRDRFCWVNTGGAVPPSCDAVVMVEDTSEGPDGLVVVRATPRGQNVRPVGEDVLAGQVLARPGDPVTPALQALLLCAGVREIPALPKPRVLFIPTGDEILSVEEWFRSGATPPPGTVVESNSTLLRGLFRGWGMDLHVHPLVPDDPVQIRQALDEGAESYDVVLLGAGSAKGKRDHSASVLREGGGLLFRWLLMKPGRPAMGGAWKGKPVLVLPGFPMSTAVVAWGLVHPFLEHLASSPVPSGEELCSSLGCGEPQECRLLVPLSSAQGMEDWVRLKCARIRDQVVAWPLSTGASSLFALAECDALGVLPRETLELPKGSPLSFYPLKRMGLDRTALFQGSDDPAFQRLASRVRLRGAQVAIRTVGSLGGLAALARGEAHLAACHLLDPQTGIYNDSFLAQFDPQGQWWRRRLYYREQGLIVPSGNPLGLRTIRDLAARGIRLANRQPGAGTRVLLDHLLGREGIPPAGLEGYDIQCVSHMEAANRVASGQADVTLGIRAAAEALGLDFIPLAVEPFEIVGPREFEGHPALEVLMACLEDPAWRLQIEALGGYRWSL